ncbi:nuclear transport factor 2 family protein [Chitinophaga arvensicola]|uniref:Ketosteroid isomerase-related protein n=1 Tax=Chitinophaga arvensicola TaxID=29529 RepID=A0A1I0S6H0_9BACT|nr:nuclear transport factor 2 family protein [Chitinophaga arvensicola]SEW50965.1 Ketosteroid isomerase-related protein [Chitinophaga arvensicola]
MKILPIILLVFLFAACVQPGAKSSLANANVQVVKELFEAFNDHNWTKLADCYKDTATFLDPSLGKTPVLQTRAQTAQKYADLQKMFPDVKDSVLNIYGDKNHITVEFISTATGPDGVKWQLPICTVFTVEEGKIVRDNTYYDNSH